LITVNLLQPHLYPRDMLIYRLVYNATGADVSDVCVQGRLVVEARKVLTTDETATLERVQDIYERFIERAGLTDMRKNPEHFWGASRSSFGPTT
jgi:cytosine/adenosine deaminase-related metal-dependent hydrolase